VIATPLPAGAPAPAPAARPRPRLGFLGVGWIGRHRLQAIVESGAAEAAAVADPAAGPGAGGCGCEVVPSLDDLLARGLDGVVIATPSAQHAEQAIRALEAGVAVFCQKPLGRTAGEVRRVLDAARAADRLLAVDLSYRHVAGVAEMRALARGGALGHVYAAELAFHNAYGPDKPWYADPRLAGGGCVMDLGIHLVDLALHVLGGTVEEVQAVLRAGGRRIRGRESGLVEDHAAALLTLSGGTTVSLACSWRLAAGADCLVAARFHGTQGGVALRNVNGSFYDLEVVRLAGTREEPVAGPPDAWGGRAAVAFARAVAAGGRYDPAVEGLLDVHATLDRFYEA
jgi:predicted dehydrogenase